MKFDIDMNILCALGHGYIFMSTSTVFVFNGLNSTWCLIYIFQKHSQIEKKKMTIKLSEQGPLEKSLQNSVAFERQKNMDNRVGIIRGSVQVNAQIFEEISKLKLYCFLFYEMNLKNTCLSVPSWWTKLWNTSRTCRMTLISATRPYSLEVRPFLRHPHKRWKKKTYINLKLISN